MAEKIQEAFSENQFVDIDDPDFELYSGGFFSDADRTTMNEVAVAEPYALSGFTGRFQDERLDEMLFRYRARNWPDSLTESESVRWRLHCDSRWQMDGRAGNLKAEMSELIASETGDRLRVLQDLKSYIDQL